MNALAQYFADKQQTDKRRKKDQVGYLCRAGSVLQRFEPEEKG